MKRTEQNKAGGLLRNFVETMPEYALGINSEWTWFPNKKIDKEKLAAASPTTEYMTENE